jgi:hypothetical protein
MIAATVRLPVSLLPGSGLHRAEPYSTAPYSTAPYRTVPHRTVTLTRSTDVQLPVAASHRRIVMSMLPLARVRPSGFQDTLRTSAE